ncbi:hypothetical protein MBLNU13_g05239t1 [Cladosporium sp. NU13]
MRLVSTLSIWLLAGLATAFDGNAINATCTNTLTESAKCCVAPAYHTKTSYTDCGGCALETTTTGPNCDIARCALPTTLTNTTTTITACSASPTCTHVVTSTEPFGCQITVPPRTRTELIDCKGCALTTTTVVNRLFGLGPECLSGRKTVQGGTGVATATKCLAEE